MGVFRLGVGGGLPSRKLPGFVDEPRSLVSLPNLVGVRKIYVRSTEAVEVTISGDGGTLSGLHPGSAPRFRSAIAPDVLVKETHHTTALFSLQRSDTRYPRRPPTDSIIAYSGHQSARDPSVAPASQGFF